MIVLCAGMQKAGTGWYFNLTNDVLIAAQHQDVRAIRDKFHLHSIMKHYNCNIGTPSLSELIRVTVPHFFGNTFALKTHSGPTRALRCLLSAGIVRATYIYRDPRDVLVATFEHGERIRRAGGNHTFGKLVNAEEAIFFIKRLLAIWDAWMHCDNVLKVRYEDLLADPAEELKRLADFLSLDVSHEILHGIASTYQADKLNADMIDRLHFNKGFIGRFASVLSPDEQALCKKHFGHHLRKMGYQEGLGSGGEASENLGLHNVLQSKKIPH